MGVTIHHLYKDDFCHFIPIFKQYLFRDRLVTKIQRPRQSLSPIMIMYWKHLVRCFSRKGVINLPLYILSFSTIARICPRIFHWKNDNFSPTILHSEPDLPFQIQTMGSFTSAPKILNDDTADNDLRLPLSLTWDDLQLRCEEELSTLPSKIVRKFQAVTYPSQGDCEADDKIRVMQWNILSQALAVSTDKFVACPLDALSWYSRRWRLLEEIVSSRPDIACFQEVDHYQFFKSTLGPLGFRGVFFPKPDSPCFYIAENNGPDGCAIFINETKFELLDTKTRSLEVWGYQSNQVVILCKLRQIKDNSVFWIATTHLKARQGPLLATMRREQGRDLMDFIKLYSGSHPVIITGDFNANPSEPVYQSLISDDTYPLDSAYRYLSNKKVEPPYTTWKIREDGEYCQTLDYIFFTQNSFKVDTVLQLPTSEDIGEGRVPSYRYPSDHFALVADLSLHEP